MRAAELRKIPVTISSGASLSDAALVGRLHVVGLIFPAAWTAAAVTLAISPDGEDVTEAAATYYRADDDSGTEISLVWVASTLLPFTPLKFMPAARMKIRSGTAAAAVNQGADRLLYIIGRAYE